jgi:hypothetical protein
MTVLRDDGLPASLAGPSIAGGEAGTDMVDLGP